MLKKYNLFIILFVAIVLTAYASTASDPVHQELSVFQSYTADLLSNKNESVLNAVTSKKEPSYAECFMAGSLYDEAKNNDKAILWYARSAFTQRELPANSKEIAVYLNSILNRSPLYGESLVEIAQILVRRNRHDEANAVLALVPKPVNPALETSIIDLQAGILSNINSSVSIALYLDLVKKDERPSYYLKIGSLLYYDKDYESALKYYFKALEFPDTDWTYSAASAMIAHIFSKLPGAESQLTEFQKVRLAEGLRIQKKYPQSLKMWKSINPSKLNEEGLYYYTKNYIRLLVNLGQYLPAEIILNENMRRLSGERRAEVYDDIAARLYQRHRYRLITKLIPKITTLQDKNNASAAYNYRLKSLEKTNSPERLKEASYFLKYINSSSKIAESAYFSFCFELLQNQKNQQAATCLEDLRNLTQNAETGGRSRFFLATIYDAKGDKETAGKYYREVYTNSPDHYLALKSLQNAPSQGPANLPEYISESGEAALPEAYRTWIAGNFNRPGALNLYFEKKQANKKYGLHPSWENWENDLKHIGGGLNELEHKAALFTAMGNSGLAYKYLAHIENPARRYMIGIYSAMTVKNAYLSYRYINAYLNETSASTDIFLMPPSAIQCLYPIPYREFVEKSSRNYNMKEEFIYALMKQESAFHPGVTSHAGAKGLMQIMPSTARDLNRRNIIPNLDLYNPEHSIELGTKYFSYMYKQHNGQFELIAIAYNAGPGRLARWLRRYNGENTVQFLEQIPIEETYYYVQRTRAFYDRYHVLLKHFY